MAGNGTFTMERGIIVGNSASDGGGVYVNGTFTMEEGIIAGNSVSYDGGGGVYMEHSGTFIMKGGTIVGNSVSYDGGGVYMAGNGTFTMERGIITKNSASSAGVYVGDDETFIKRGGGTIDATNSAENGKVVYVYVHKSSNRVVRKPQVPNNFRLKSDKKRGFY